MYKLHIFFYYIKIFLNYVCLKCFNYIFKYIAIEYIVIILSIQIFLIYLHILFCIFNTLLLITPPMKCTVEDAAFLRALGDKCPRSGIVLYYSPPTQKLEYLMNGLTEIKIETPNIIILNMYRMCIQINIPSVYGILNIRLKIKSR